MYTVPQTCNPFWGRSLILVGLVLALMYFLSIEVSNSIDRRSPALMFMYPVLIEYVIFLSPAGSPVFKQWIISSVR